MSHQPMEVILQETAGWRWAGPFKVRGSVRQVITSAKNAIHGAPHLRAIVCTHDGHVVREIATDVYGRPHFE